MNYFKFNSVGQGLFYVGSLAHKSFNFVYDCGTDNKQEYLNSSIDSFIEEIKKDKSDKPHIDFVVVSHLHRDHFSGLFELACKTNIKRVYLPYLGSDRNFISCILAYVIFCKNDKTKNDIDLSNLFYFMCGLYGIRETRDFQNIETTFIQENIEYDANVNKNDLNEFKYPKHEEYVYIGLQKYWKFVFINQGIDKNKLYLLTKEMNKILTSYNIKSVEELITKKEGIKKIKEIYENVFSVEIKKDLSFLNRTSIVLLHYPLYNSPKVFYTDSDENIKFFRIKNKLRCFSFYDYSLNEGFDFNWIKNSTTLLLGDAMMDNVMENIILSQLKNEGLNDQVLFGVLQVPHHGAKDNWLALKKTSIASEVYVIPFGLGNRHKHPNTTTIDDLVYDKKNIQFVNQIQSFEYYID